ncbi:ras-related protein Rab-8B-like [Haliotis rubra]|uniref:ras-related protein Rab-8B-like n=1 Tax=Haliotis rubra TaxID=36100 RepID=UPI001EE5E365|nr:ras-related protein Rab-8B-like [Haliotis rubra]
MIRPVSVVNFNMATSSYSDHEYTVKAVLIGDLGVGKSTFLHTFMEGKFTRVETSSDTLGFKQKTIIHSDKNVRLQMWDTAGQEKYRSLTASYYRGANGCIIMFDVTNEETFDHVHRWFEDMREYASHKEIAVVLVGTKCHEHDREVTIDRASSFAEEHNIPYIEVSAERDINSVNSVFETLVEKVLENISRNSTMSQSSDQSEVSKLSRNQKKKKSWCSC